LIFYFSLFKVPSETFLVFF